MGFTLACLQQTSAEHAEDFCSNTGDGFNHWCLFCLKNSYLLHFSIDLKFSSRSLKKRRCSAWLGSKHPFRNCFCQHFSLLKLYIFGVDIW